jgi:hypothetical protein
MHGLLSIYTLVDFTSTCTSMATKLNKKKSGYRVITGRENEHSQYEIPVNAQIMLQN